MPTSSVPVFSSIRARFGVLSALLALSAALGGCGFSGAAGDLRTASINGSVALQPKARVIVYAPLDENSADVYLTDLTREQLESTSPITSFTGSIVHLHLFVRPRAGRTPIESTASSASVRHAVLTGGPVGIYGGGGFLMPDEAPGERHFGGSVTAGTLRLTNASPGFDDRLGAADISGSFNARRDDAMAALIGTRLAEAVDATR